ncbi:MAG TPA: hypothetical protein VIK60_02310 [Vicinamibacterales bacterium]
MKQFVKENLAIVAAIVLPLVLVALFALSSLVISRVVADPQYDFLIATNFYGGSNEAFYFDVVQNRLKISYSFPVRVNGNYQNGNISRLWRVRVPAMTVEEIPLVPPPRGQDNADGQRVPIEIAGVSDLQVLSTQPAPDGYTFQQSYDYYNSNLMRELFGTGSRGEQVHAIVKDGRVVPVRNLGGAPYSAYNAHFIGWIAKDQ